MFFTFPLTFLAFPLTFPALTARTFPTLSLTSFPALSASRVFFFPLCSPRISCLFKQLADESINYLVFLRVYRAKLKHCMSINGHLARRDTVSWPGRREETQEGAGNGSPGLGRGERRGHINPSEQRPRPPSCAWRRARSSPERCALVSAFSERQTLFSAFVGTALGCDRPPSQPSGE